MEFFLAFSIFRENHFCQQNSIILFTNFFRKLKNVFYETSLVCIHLKF